MGQVLSLLDAISTTPYPSLVAIATGTFATSLAAYKQELQQVQGTWSFKELFHTSRFLSFVKHSPALQPLRQVLLKLCVFAIASDLFGGIWWRHAIHKHNMRAKLRKALESNSLPERGVCRPFGTPGPPCILVEVSHLLNRDIDALQLYQSKGGLLVHVTPLVASIAKGIGESYNPDYVVCCGGNTILSAPNFEVFHEDSLSQDENFEILQQVQAQDFAQYIAVVTDHGDWLVNDLQLIMDLEDATDGFQRYTGNPNIVQVDSFEPSYFTKHKCTPQLVYFWGGSLNDPVELEHLRTNLSQICQDIADQYGAVIELKPGDLPNSILLSRRPMTKVDVVAELCEKILHLPLGDCLVFGDSDSAAHTMLRGRWAVCSGSATSLARSAADEVRHHTNLKPGGAPDSAWLEDECISEVLDELFVQTNEVDMLRRNIIQQQQQVTSLRERLMVEGSHARELESRLEEFERFASMVEQFSPAPRRDDNKSPWSSTPPRKN